MQNVACERSPLRDLVRTLSICFRLRPCYGNVDAEAPEIGCEVELIGLHNSTGKHVAGGCPHCLKVLPVLLELNDLLLSQQNRPNPVGHIAAQFEKSIRYASSRGDWPEVLLDVKIIRSQALREVPENWSAELTDEIRTELRDVGCREVSCVFMPTESVADRRALLEEVAG